MVAAERKLEQLTSVLTARQRAILVIRGSHGNGTADERLHRLCPPHDKQEFESILKALDRGNNSLHSTLAFLLEWVANMEIEVHWPGTLTAYQEREKGIPASQRKSLPMLPPVWNMKRTVYRAWGRALEDEEEPKSWDGFRERMEGDLRKGLGMRWQEYLQTEAVLEEASTALGTEVSNPTVREVVDGLRDGVLGVKREFEALGYRVELPSLDWEVPTFAKGMFNLDVLREVPPEKHAREWLHGKQLEELEAWEKEQADALDEG